jgi:hypothetical protein
MAEIVIRFGVVVEKYCPSEYRQRVDLSKGFAAASPLILFLSCQFSAEVRGVTSLLGKMIDFPRLGQVLSAGFS